MSLRSQMKVPRRSGFYHPPSISTCAAATSVEVVGCEQVTGLARNSASTASWAVPLLTAVCLSGYVIGSGSAGRVASSGVCVAGEPRPDGGAGDGKYWGPNRASYSQIATPVW